MYTLTLGLSGGLNSSGGQDSVCQFVSVSLIEVPLSRAAEACRDSAMRPSVCARLLGSGRDEGFSVSMRERMTERRSIDCVR